MFVSARGYSSICNLYSVHFTLTQTQIFLFSHCAKCLNIYISEGHQSHHTSDPTHSLWKDTMRGLNSEDVTYNLRNCWSQLKVWRCSLNSLPANLTGFEVKWTETRRWWWRARTAQWTIQRCREDGKSHKTGPHRRTFSPEMFHTKVDAAVYITVRTKSGQTVK